ncbi:tigger transposable element-derived protein 2-like [Branchiostoma floridae]|uniref:Tigger transposable element-derived protein 2-like n=1 Tax=Branchiostoma floridae TaxID=7739 RepID=A0A9J7M907_BRAFL|nr:tigger transposable element-derived protein 2-like [Branchiostoma floridae]
MPGKRRLMGFRRRHPEISLRSPDSLDRARAAMSNAKIVGDHFLKVGELLEENNLQNRPHQIYNADETGMALDAKKSRVIVPTASKRAPSIRSGGRDHISVMSCVSAAGGVVPPMIVFNKALPSGKFSDGGPPGALYASSESGYINKELFEQWYFKIFLPHCHKERPILLVLDQHGSHLSLKVLMSAMEEKIVIYGLPPHTSHFTQPLDVTVFSVLKTKWATTLEALQAVDSRFQARKTTFPRIFASVQDQVFNADKIKAGFKKTGIFPFNEDAIDSVWTDMSTSEGPSAQEGSSGESGELSSAERSNSETCPTCGHAPNPLVGTLVPEHLQDILRPVNSTTAKQTRRRKLSARVMTHEDIVEELRKKEEDERTKKAKAEERKKKAELTRLQKEAKAKQREDKKRKREMENGDEEKEKELGKEEEEKEEEEKEMDAQKEEEKEQSVECQRDGSKRRRVKKRDSRYDYDY